MVLNTEITQVCKAVLQNRMTLDVVTAAQGGTYCMIKVECCLCIQDYDQNVTRLLTDMNNQIGALKDLTLPLKDWLHSWSGVGTKAHIKGSSHCFSYFHYNNPNVFCHFVLYC